MHRSCSEARAAGKPRFPISLIHLGEQISSMRLRMYFTNDHVINCQSETFARFASPRGAMSHPLLFLDTVLLIRKKIRQSFRLREGSRKTENTYAESWYRFLARPWNYCQFGASQCRLVYGANRIYLISGDCQTRPLHDSWMIFRLFIMSNRRIRMTPGLISAESGLWRNQGGGSSLSFIA